MHSLRVRQGLEMTRVFFRDDDVGDLTPPLEWFIELFVGREIPVNYQVVPTFLTNESIAYLRQCVSSYGNLVALHQHGLRHSQEIRGTRVWSEFANNRPLAEQQHDIREGRNILNQAFQDGFDPSVFTPPQHKYDRNTLRALRDEGVLVLSASTHVSLPHRIVYAFGRRVGLTSVRSRGISWHGQQRPDVGLYELSVSVFADNGGHRVQNMDALLQQFAVARRRFNDVGIMLHHQVWRNSEDQDFLKRFLDRLTGLEDVTFHSMKELLSQRTV